MSGSGDEEPWQRRGRDVRRKGAAACTLPCTVGDDEGMKQRTVVAIHPKSGSRGATREMGDIDRSCAERTRRSSRRRRAVVVPSRRRRRRRRRRPASASVSSFPSFPPLCTRVACE